MGRASTPVGGAVAAVPGSVPAAAYDRLNDDGPQEEDGGRRRRGRTLSSASVETSGDLTVAVAFEGVTYAVPWDPATQDGDGDGAVAGASSASVATTTAKSNVGVGADERKLILSNVSGVVHPGECCAILGSSGTCATARLPRRLRHAHGPCGMALDGVCRLWQNVAPGRPGRRDAGRAAAARDSPL